MLKEPPTEEHLLQNTLWPEIQKLYGHGYEIFSLAVDVKNKLIVSACKAAKAEHANIIVWEEQSINSQTSFKQIDSLSGHDLTIVQMKFSNSTNSFLSVSRDRSWKLFTRHTDSNNNSKSQFKLTRSIAPKNNYHTRIVWSCDWSHDDRFFVTTSRDKRACVWSGEVGSGGGEEIPLGKSGKPYLELECAITACAFGPDLTVDKR